MRRSGRWLFGGVAVISLALAVAAGAMWVRSHWVMDSVSAQRSRMSGGAVALIRVALLSTRGTVETNISYGTLDPGADRGAGLRPGWTARHSSLPAGPLMFHAIPARSIFERIGFRFVMGHPGFVGGLMSKSATHVIIDVPYSGLIAMLLVVPAAWLIVRRRRRVRLGHCPKCGYDLTGNVSGQCSECGRLIESA